MNAETLAQVRRLQEAARNAYHSWSKLTPSKVRRDNPDLAMRMRQLEAAAEELDLFLPEQADPLLVASAADVQRQAQNKSAELLRDDAHARREQEAQLASEARWIPRDVPNGEPGHYEPEPEDDRPIPF